MGPLGKTIINALWIIPVLAGVAYLYAGARLLSQRNKERSEESARRSANRSPAEYHKDPNHHHLTVGALRRALQDVPDDTPVSYQRIEDVYFDKYNWNSVEMVWEKSHNPKYPDHMSDYIVAWSSWYNKDDRFFVINAHY